MRSLVVLCAALGLTSCNACFLTTLQGDGGRPFPCDPALGEDAIDGGGRPDGGARQCSSGWRCGLERRCHERGVAAPYQCDDNTWCEGGWECTNGFCAPFVDDGLRAGRDAGPLSIVRVSPVLLDRMPDTIAAAQDVQVGPSAAFYGSGVAWTLGDQYQLVARSRLGPPDDPIVGQYDNFHFYETLPGGTVYASGASASAVPQTLVLTDQGVGYVAVDFDGGGASRPGKYLPYAPDAGGTQLRIFESPPVPYALVWGTGPDLTVIEYPDVQGALPPVIAKTSRPVLNPRDAGAVLATKITDFAHVNFTPALKQVTVGVLDDRLWFSERRLPEGTFLEVAVGGSTHIFSDAGLPYWQDALIFPPGGAFDPLAYDAGYLIQGRAYLPGRVRTRLTRLAIEVSSPGLGPTLLLAQVELVSNGVDTFPFAALMMPPCAVCPPGWELTDFAPVGDQEPNMEARCQTATHFVTFVMFPAAGSLGCSSELVREGRGAVNDFIKPQTATSGHGGWAGAHGQLWVERVAARRARVHSRRAAARAGERG